MTTKISWSAHETVQKCGRKAELTYFNGLRRPLDTTSDNIMVGLITHAGLSGYITAVGDEWKDPYRSAMIAMIDETNRLREEAPDNGDLSYEEESFDAVVDACYLNAKQIIEEYIPYLGIGERYRPVRLSELSEDLLGESQDRWATEVEFRLPIEEDILLHGYVDAVLYDTAQNDYVLVDWKTTGAFPSEYDIRMDGQLRFYASALNDMGIEVGRGLYIFLHRNTMNEGARINKNNTLSIASQRITWERWYASLPTDLRKVVDADLDGYREWANEKLSPIENFVRAHEVVFSPVVNQNVHDNTRRVAKRLEQIITDAQNDVPAPATYSRYGCQYCDFRDLCLALQEGEDTTEIMKTFDTREVDNEDKHAKLR